ncbi:hypothetical protein Taro_010184 [Colocasia esculenta]|uniref:Uncharacterized protein n=1 Tax=Colocasia esculenta TaxID=4460 RepID=A0A843U688_COLES|nr:hypothetical protein [Colocasia esculenta]
MVGLPCFRSLQLCCACRPERLASISLDAGVSIGVHVWTLTLAQRPGLDAKVPSARTLNYAENHAYQAYIHAICIRFTQICHSGVDTIHLCVDTS